MLLGYHFPFGIPHRYAVAMRGPHHNAFDHSLAAALATRIIARVHRRGTLVLLSTHDADQALTMANRILVVAGKPATLAADIAVQPRGDTAAIRRLSQDLLTRFTFLARTGTETPRPAT